MKSILTTLLILLSFIAPSGFGQSVADIVQKHETQKVADIEKYLADNPDAYDKDSAYWFLSNSLTAIGDSKKVLDVLEKRYALQRKGADAPVQMLIQEIISPYIQAASEAKEKDRAKKFISDVRSDLSSHPMSQQINQILDQVLGSLALPGKGDTMDISFTSTKGKEINLAEMKGKVVLVDFWATWCGPCVQEMPNVIAAYDKYKAEGFEVIGISLDQDKSKLDSFVSQYKMTWPQYFDGKGWGNLLAKKLGISGIPATFLIGKDGVVVASNLRGSALEEAVAAALKAN